VFAIDIEINDLGWPWTAFLHSAICVCITEPTKQIWMKINIWDS